MLPRPTALGNLIEMQIIGPYPRLTNQKVQGWGLKSVFLKALQVLLMFADVLAYLTRPQMDKLSLLRAR